MTVSICINARQFTKEYTNLRQLTEALYMVARHACDAEVVEVVVLGEGEESLKVAALLQYFVTPRYLIRETFQGAWKRGLDKNIFSEARKCPLIKSLKCLKPWKKEGTYYREGVAVVRAIRRGKTASGKVARVNVKDRTTEWVNAGLKEAVKIEGERVPFGVRVTVELIGDGSSGRVVSSKKAWGYCGYVVRGAADEAGVFAGAGSVAGEEGYSKVVGVTGAATSTTTADPTTTTTTNEGVTLVAVNTLEEVWDSRVQVCSRGVADACVAGICLTCRE